MKNALFITSTFIYQEDLNGIKDKIFNQKKSLQNLGYNVDLINVREKNTIFINDLKLKTFTNHIFFSLFFFKAVYSCVRNNSYDLVYIRNPFVADFIGYGQLLKKFSDSKIILEIPTFPYKKEKKTIPQKIVYFLESFSRLTTKKYVDLILYSGNKEEKIFGVPSLQVKHSSNLENTVISKKEFNKKEINIIAVASFNEWHGYDRFFEGLNQFVHKKADRGYHLKIHIVGNKEPLYSTFKKYVMENNLDDNVNFYGALSGKALDEVFDKADVGLGSLGMHRIDLFEGSPLKSAEYAVRGIPFVVGYKDSNFYNFDYCFQIPGDESMVDLESLIEWYFDLKVNRNEMRNYVLENFSWEKQLKKILGN
jgi:glycosyltransferase involved in cell wall biosynthesis